MEEVYIKCPVVNSDHNVLQWTFRSFTYMDQKEGNTSYDYKNVNYKKIHITLDEIDWKEKF